MNLSEENVTTVMTHSQDEKPPVNWRTRLFGEPLRTADAPHQTIGKVIGLAVFAADALSSTGYATQELMVILVMAGTAGLGYSFGISIVIVALLTILTISYEQTIHAYPGGGGAYIVARDNLGEIPALIAAAALLMDYILTVSVSISSGVAHFVSAYPVLFNFRVEIAVVLVLFVMGINLRGVRESGVIFSIPTYFFVIMMYVTVSVGLFRYFTVGLGVVPDPPVLEEMGTLQPVTLFLLLRAFANGTSAVTGVEAISNGIMAFKEPRSSNAGKTLIWMSCILGSLLLGITFLAQQIQAIPSEHETVISQLVRVVYGGRGSLYFMAVVSTTVILIMAANTAFADFPRLSALTAGDGFLPRQLSHRGDRLVYSRGIILLSIIASLLIIGFQASVTNLIPLYAIGVFVSFTLSQGGMARRWFKSGRLAPDQVKVERGSTLRYEKTWRFRMMVNSLGSITTAVVAVVFAVAKFVEGAWVVIILIPMLVTIFSGIHRHYKSIARELSLDRYWSSSRIARHRVIILVAGIHRGSLAALRYAMTLSNDVTAVHISTDPVETEKLQKKWDTWGEGVRLVILDSPYRMLVEPLTEYIDRVESVCQPNELMTIVVPQFISAHWWNNLLHTRTADNLREVLLNRKEIVIVEVPYKVD